MNSLLEDKWDDLEYLDWLFWKTKSQDTTLIAFKSNYWTTKYLPHSSPLEQSILNRVWPADILIKYLFWDADPFLAVETIVEKIFDKNELDPIVSSFVKWDKELPRLLQYLLEYKRYKYGFFAWVQNYMIRLMRKDWKEEYYEDIDEMLSAIDNWDDISNFDIPEKIKAKPEKKQYYEEMEADVKKDLKEYKDRKSTLESLRKRVWVDVNRKNLYNVEIPDPIKKDTPTGSNYLEEDGNIQYNQIEKIAEWLEKYDERGNRGKNAFLRGITYDLKDISWWWDDKLNKYVTKWHMSWKKLYEHLVDYFWGRERWEKKASKFLESLWYDGIHYFWGRDWEAYVIFNDDALKINSHTKYQKTKATWNSKNRVTSK